MNGARMHTVFLLIFDEVINCYELMNAFYETMEFLWDFSGI